ncbi:MAG TPA: FecR domain-containing protein [bacterium]|nr:FecR domain-containing protein [bacterium]
MKYKIKEKDTLFTLAEKYLGDSNKWKELSKLNKIKNPLSIPVGTVIEIPVNDEKIYTIESLSGNVWQRRTSEDDWFKANRGDSFPEGTEFKTEANSRASVKTKDGDVFFIRENSQIQFQIPELSEKMKPVKLSFGSLSADIVKKTNLNNKTKFAVSTPISVVGIRGTKFIYDFDTELLKSKLSVNEGVVENSASGKTVEINEGFGSITEKGKSPSAPIALPDMPKLFFPDNGFLTNKNELNLEWSKIAEAAAYRIEIAYDTMFAVLEASAIIPKSGAFLNKETIKINDIPEGQFYWRITGFEANGLEGKPSLTRSFVIDRRLPALEIKSPENLSVIENKIIISGATDSENEIIINGSKIIADKSGGFSAGMIFQPGIACVNIKAVNKAGNYSEKQMFFIVKGEDISVENNVIKSYSKTLTVQGEIKSGMNLINNGICLPVSSEGKISGFFPAPSALEPLNLAFYEAGKEPEKIFKNYSILIPSAGTPELIFPSDKFLVNKNNAAMEWNRTENSTAYKIEIASENEFKNILVSGIINSKSSHINIETAKIFLPEKDGTYYWRVTAVDKNNIEGKPSEFRTIILKTQKPKLSIFEPADMSVSADKTLFKGKTESGNTAYINGAKAAIDSKGEFTAEISFEQGIQFVRILIVDNAGNETVEQLVLLITGNNVEIDKNIIKCSLPYLKIGGELNRELTVKSGSLLMPVSEKGFINGIIPYSKEPVSAELSIIDEKGGIRKAFEGYVIKFSK